MSARRLSWRPSSNCTGRSAPLAFDDKDAGRYPNPIGSPVPGLSLLESLVEWDKLAAYIQEINPGDAPPHETQNGAVHDRPSPRSCHDAPSDINDIPSSTTILLVAMGIQHKQRQLPGQPEQETGEWADALADS